MTEFPYIFSELYGASILHFQTAHVHTIVGTLEFQLPRVLIILKGE